MKIKNFELINTLNNLDRFIKKDIPLPVRVSYAVNKNIRKLMDEYKMYDEERAKITAGYDEKSEEQKKEADKKLAELLDIRTEVDVYKITMEDIGNCGNLSVNDVTALDFMIEEE